MFNRTKEPYTPLEKTPLRPRRLSIENCSTIKTDKPVNPEDKTGSKSPLPRSRRLSLEGARTIKKDHNLQPKVSAEPEAVSKLNGQFKLELQAKTPLSPTKTTHQKRLIKVDSRIQIHPLKLPQSPEPPVLDKNDHAFCTDTNSLTTKVSGSTNGKGSQIRRSLRTIGKLINGPDKRCVCLLTFKL